MIDTGIIEDTKKIQEQQLLIIEFFFVNFYHLWVWLTLHEVTYDFWTWRPKKHLDNWFYQLAMLLLPLSVKMGPWCMDGLHILARIVLVWDCYSYGHPSLSILKFLQGKINKFRVMRYIVFYLCNWYETNEDRPLVSGWWASLVGCLVI